MWSRPANMDGDVEMVVSEDREMYRRRYDSQTEISAGRAYICITKKKSQKLKVGDYMNPRARVST
jgi:hypothetical protein